MDAAGVLNFPHQLMQEMELLRFQMEGADRQINRHRVGSDMGVFIA